MFTVPFLKAVAERAFKTFAQVLAALLVTAGTGVLDTDWSDKFSVAGMATLISILTSIASGAIGGGGPSLTGAETVTGETSE